MPDVATAPTASAAQTRAAGSRMLGYYLGVGGVKVDCLFDTSNFLTRDADGKVVVNGANPNYIFNVAAANPSRGVIADIANNAAAGLNGSMLSFTQNTINNWCIGQAPGVDAFAIYRGRNGAADGTEVLRINSGGNVGIGVDPVNKLDVQTSAGRFSVTSAGSASVRIKSSGTMQYDAGAASSHQFLINGADSVVITSAGNVGIGTTTPAARVHAKGSGEVARFETTVARGGGSAFLSFNDPTGRKGFFGFGGVADAFVVANEMNEPVVINTNGNNRWMFEAGGNFRPYNDNGYSVGVAANRISVVYAGTGTINTSDERLKVWIGRATEDRVAKDRRIARAILDELGWYQFTDAVTEKGPDGARWHFGARAQRIWQIVADEGLAPPLVDVEGILLPDITWTGPVAPAWLCFDGWNDQFEDVYRDVVHVDEVQVGEEGTGEFGPDGAEIMRPVIEEVERIEREPTGERQLVREAGHLFGFRVDEMNLLLSWALHDRLSALEAAA